MTKANTMKNTPDLLIAVMFALVYVRPKQQRAK